MLHDVQTLMDQLISRDQSSRQELKAMNDSLADAQFEIDQELGFLSVQKAEFSEQQQKLLKHQQQLTKIETAKDQLNQL